MPPRQSSARRRSRALPCWRARPSVPPQPRPSPARARRSRRSPRSPARHRRPPLRQCLLARRDLGNWCRPAAPPAPCTGFRRQSTAKLAPVRRATSASASALVAAVTAVTSNRSRLRSTRSRVDLPIEPVAPRIAILRVMSGRPVAQRPSASRLEPGRRAGRARRHGPAAMTHILDPCPALHAAFEQVAALRGNRQHRRNASRGRPRPVPIAHAPPSNVAATIPAIKPLDGLVRADRRARACASRSCARRNRRRCRSTR